MTLYLKYRPQQVSELGLKAVRETLDKILKAKELPHAFLFVGPRGTGKTSSARILAKTVNNDEAVLDSADVVEIDAASNRGIDEIRSLRESVALAPMTARYKVYIIDEVHMLTTEAFNALLKTLEEPPAHVIFVLCTTEYDKVPKTVASRCVEVKFQVPSLAEISAKLAQVVKAEKLKVTDEAIAKLAKAAKGSFRDAIKLLEQVSVVGNVDEVLQLSESANPEEFLQLVQAGETDKSLHYLNQVVAQGIAPRMFTERIIEHLRDQLLATHDRQLIALIARFERAYDQSRTSALPQLPLEILIIENSGAGPVEVVKSSPPTGPVAEKAPVSKPEKVGQKAPPVVPAKTRASHQGQFSLPDIQTKWAEVLKAVRPHNHSVEALLRSTKPVSFDGDLLELEVFYQFHKDKLESDKCRSIVEHCVGEVFAIAPVRLALRLGERVAKKEEVSGAAEEAIIKAAEEIFKVHAI